ncbi:hypothetical protein KIN20_005793 [Parelaphostrongylus tenuis]|uniref:Uncharacterized protein n=1 Tax=Parelaphostrongylus tenuis TaxID=148309 RepID=A0AAD5QGB4_PARTN|nr:hypothetical protein KIN20_005793 [Parelaphostrongylus tenuis]
MVHYLRGEATDVRDLLCTHLSEEESYISDVLPPISEDAHAAVACYLLNPDIRLLKTMTS